MDKNYYQGLKGEIDPDEIGAFDFSKGYVVEEKYDGIWCNHSFNDKGHVSLISRNMKEKENEQINSLRLYMKSVFKLKNTCLAGELAFSTQAGTDYARKVGHHKTDLFDIPFYKGKEITHTKSLLDRKEILADIFDKALPEESWVVQSPWKLIHSADEVRELFDAIVAKGGEGVCVKDPTDRDYRFGAKSPFWFKVKKLKEMDYVVMGYKDTKSDEFANRGWIGAVILGLYVGGKLVDKVDVGGMTFQAREYISTHRRELIGRVVTVRGNEVFKSGSMRHPRLIAVDYEPYFILRDDKEAGECVWDQ